MWVAGGRKRTEKGREEREGGIPEVETLNHTLGKHGFYISQRKSDGGGVCTISCDFGFPGGPVVKASPSSEGGVGSIPGQGAKIPHNLQPKNKT